MIATETLYRTKDGNLVREGAPGAAFLVCRAGAAIPPDVAKRYGLKFETSKAEVPADNSEPDARQNRALSGRSLRRRTE